MAQTKQLEQRRDQNQASSNHITSKMSVNKIAWLDGVGKDIAVREGEIPVAGSKQIIVRNHAIAVNPIDCM